MHWMKSQLAIIMMFCLLISCEKQKVRILVFSKTNGYRHASIANGKLALLELGRKNKIEVDTTEDATLINEENLKRYNAVVFLSTSGDVLDPVQQGDFKRYIQAGGGFVGIHSAADTEYEWPWYGKLVGAYFKNHPKVQEATMKKARAFGPNTLPERWTKTDEWYNYKNIADDLNVIYTVDESSYKGGENGENHPIAWYHEFDGGRSFYTGLGHTKESYSDSLFIEHVWQGISYALDEDSELDYDKVKAKRVPEENRFSKTVLDFNLYEPTEMVILPDGKIVFTERRGNIKLYTPADNKVKVINTFNVWTKYEDGIIGITADPGFEKNNFLYIFYSHPQRSSNVLSRFLFRNDQIDSTSEKELLEVRTQRDTCCHTGGSLAFGPDGNLYISTGDNTSPFKSNGYSPADERPGRSPYDAQGSSGNTNDLRGKILRIHPEPDGTYTIPDGNLFPKGEPNTRPEIYAMGCRNPYRISIDEKTGYVYWGEVGPDAASDDSLRGPRGYDEVNQAKKAGFFGWPYFVGKNYSYGKFDFETKSVGPRADPEHPVNESPNNTGKRELPAVSPPFIWYPYAKSEEFPMFKSAGRNAMAGPFYYSEHYKGQENAFPDYFDGKLMIYDWMRNWIFMVSLDNQGAITDIEPFMPNTKFNSIIDMAYGPDGKLYMLEYGKGWFKQNIDATLTRIDYNKGNRTPVAKFTADKFNGAVPLTVKFDVTGTYDPDKDKLKYELVVDTATYVFSDSTYALTFDKPGVFNPEFRVTDDKGLKATAKLQVIAGNEPPQVKAEITGGNKTFFFPGTPVQYAVQVSDREDGSTNDGKIPANAVTVTFDFLKGYDMTEIAQGHQMAVAEMPGKTLIDKSDCKSCHLVDQKSAGPGYKEIAEKYKNQRGAKDQLASKIIKGGGGTWGATEMAAHPQISIEEARKMVDYILSIGEKKEAKKLPLAGKVIPGNEQEGAYLLTATYYDKGQAGLPSIPAAATIALRSPMLTADHATDLKGARKTRFDNTPAIENIKHNSAAAFKNIDLTGIKRGKVYVHMDPDQQAGGEIEIRLDKSDGKIWGKTKVSAPGLSLIDTKFETAQGVHDLYVIFKNEKAGDKNLFYFGGIKFENK